MKQVVILAGGKGTRLGAVLGGLPKPMMDVGGKPLLQHQLELARRHGFTEAVLFTGHRAEAIESFFGDGAALGLRLVYHRESQPLGTAGAVMEGRALLAERFLVMYGDTLLDVDLGRFWDAHGASGADVTLFLHPNDHPADSDVVEVDAQGRVLAFHGYPHPPDVWLPNQVNAALYAIEKRVLPEPAAPPRVIDFAKHLFPELHRQGRRFWGYQSPEYIKDLGTPERYARGLADWRAGKPAQRSLSVPQPAVFLDRDGTLVREDGYIRSPEQLHLLDGVGAALRRLNQSAYRTVLVTNQPVIARGEATEATLQRIHHKLETLLGREGAYLDRLYWCPHHPDAGFPGERRELKIRCECRKPAVGMLERAVKELSLALPRSWFIGDSTVDVRTAHAAGVRSILMRTGEAGRDGRFPDRPDFVFHALGDAVDYILQGHAAHRRRLEPVAGRIRPGQLVGIAGLAHSGKSSSASVLRELLRERGLQACIVPLDAWIRSEADRGGPGPQHSYGYAAIEAALVPLASRAGRHTIRMPRYERSTRTSHPDGEVLEVSPGDIVLVEGVVALDVPGLDRVLDLKVFLTCDEAVRRARFLQDYRWRGTASEEGALARYAEREVHENPRIRATRERADAVVETGP
jgi:histidinol-phosphate phosphatase family protein